MKHYGNMKRYDPDHLFLGCDLLRDPQFPKHKFAERQWDQFHFLVLDWMRQCACQAHSYNSARHAGKHGLCTLAVKEHNQLIKRYVNKLHMVLPFKV